MTDLENLRALQDRALQACAWRGHTMEIVMSERYGRGTDGGWMSRHACTVCGAEVQCETHPRPNGIDVGGPAVALNCPATGIGG